jgi:7,8-dihydroneopterin aldolase/epimerase/oxygenase
MNSGADTIFIVGLAIHAYHGVMEHEAAVGQTFLLDLELGIDLAEASRSDKIANTASYDEIVDCVAGAFRTDRFRLLEAAAGAVAAAVLARFPKVRRVRVTVHKPHAPIAATFADLGVSIVRERHG